MYVCPVGLGESNLGGGEQVKRKKESKRPLDVLDDDQTLSQASMQVPTSTQSANYRYIYTLPLSTMCPGPGRGCSALYV